MSTAVQMWLLAQPEVSFVFNREDDVLLQGLGIDYQVALKGGGKLSVEVKADSYKSGNAFFEVQQEHALGCFLTSTADVWLYFYWKLDKLYWLPLDEVREFVMGPECRFTIAECNSTFGGGGKSKVSGRLVAMKDVVAACPGVKCYDGVLATVGRTLGEMQAS